MIKGSKVISLMKVDCPCDHSECQRGNNPHSESLLAFSSVVLK